MAIEDLISEIDAEIARLEQARTLLSGITSPAAKKRGRPAGLAKATSVAPAKKVARKKARHVMSPEARRRIAAAQKARWVAQKKASAKGAAEKAPAKKAPAKAAKPVEPRSSE